MAKWAASSGSAGEKDVDCQSLGMEIEKEEKKFPLFGPKNLLICRSLLRFFSIALAADRWHSATIAVSLSSPSVCIHSYQHALLIH